jgi:hypothetical protein
MLKRRYSLIRCREIALCLCLVLIFIYLHMHHASFTAIDSEPSSTVYKVTDEASKASCTVPLKLDTCLAITVEQYERTGNNLVQLITALQLLEACTGIALPKFNIGLRDVFWVPEILGVNGCFQPKDLTIILQKCAKITLGRELFHTRELTTSVLEKTACYQRALMQQASFPPKSNPRQTVIQDVHRLLYRDSFVDGIDFSSTAVAHIRGGDVFKRDYIKAAYYAQPPCSYYYRAFQHSKAAKLLVVTDDDKNPCIQYLADHVPELELLMGTTPTRAFDALRRAPILISTRSTFSQNAISLSLHRKRMVYAPQDTSGEAGPTGPRHGYTKGMPDSLMVSVELILIFALP